MKEGPAVVFLLCALVAAIGFVAFIVAGNPDRAGVCLALFIGWTAHLRMEGD